ncbi:MAG TPA: inositol-3-phosphate synthase, partial [Blastocatellia bacterium]|nr:inositol-3-phosphate synthase [Blastocatellia bacterium]
MATEEIQKRQVEIREPKGKLGVLLVGLGAVSTTFIAGVEAIKLGLAEPIGSLTQMGTIRLGKRTDNRVPLIRDFLPLAKLDDLVFGAWDIFEENAYESALHCGVLERELISQLKGQLQ